MSQHNDVGRIGEDMAREYLKKQGYKVIEQNYRTKYAEIDLVAEYRPGIFSCLPAGRAKKELVFVEVRTKVGENFGSPEDTLNWAKLKKVRQNTQAYLAFKEWQGPARVDAICIVLSAKGGSASGGKPDFTVLRLTHHKNIIS